MFGTKKKWRPGEEYIFLKSQTRKKDIKMSNNKIRISNDADMFRALNKARFVRIILILVLHGLGV